MTTIRTQIIESRNSSEERAADVLSPLAREFELTCQGEDSVAIFQEAEYDADQLDVSLPENNRWKSFLQIGNAKADTGAIMVSDVRVERFSTWSPRT